MPYQRQQEQKRRYKSRSRIAGQTQHYCVANLSRHDRFSGAHRDLPKVHICANIAQRSLHQIMVANRRAARRDDDIGG